MEFNIGALGIDTAIVIALVVLIDFVKAKVDGLHAWRWWFVVVVGSGYVAGFVTELFAESTTAWLVIRSGFLFAAGMVFAHQAYKAFKKASGMNA